MSERVLNAGESAAKLLLWLCFLIGPGTSLLSAQSSKISGQVLDTSGSAVGAAQMTLVRVETGDRRQAVSGAEGFYSFPLLIPGHYELTVEKDGFRTQRETGITVETASLSTVNVTLSVGSVKQSITVQATVPLLRTGTSAVANVITHRAIADLPLIDRRSLQLTRLNGFVVPSSAGSNATFAIAGGRGDNANYYIDGGVAQNMTLGTPTPVYDPPIEGMQEFNVALSTYSAALGRSGGGVIQVATRSGTNQFHGSAYEFLRNDALNANTFFSPSKPVLRYNLFGASIGGPIKKDKTQFFFNYEGRRETTANTLLLNVPSVAEVHGDFSADLPSQSAPGRGFTVMNPSRCSTTSPMAPPDCVPFWDNVIPPEDQDRVGAALAAFYPAPNVPRAPAGKSNFVANDPVQMPYNVYMGRIDHSFGPWDRLLARLDAETDQTRSAPVFPTPGTDAYGNLARGDYYNLFGGWYHTFSPTTINEFRTTTTLRRGLTSADGANTTLADQVGLTGANPAFAPTATVQGYAQIGNSMQRFQSPVWSDQFADSLSQIHGKQSLTYGFEYRYSSNLDRDWPAAGGAFTFSNVVTGNSLASLLLGRVLKASRLEQDPLKTRSDYYGAFVQDDWRVSQKLTLNLGLRWDVDAPRWETHNRQNSFDPNALNPVSGTPGAVLFAGINGVSKYANNWDLSNFGPRLGFAWQPHDQWVIRGGGAVLYPGAYDSATPIAAALGFAISGSFASPDSGIEPAFILAQGMPAVSHPNPADLTAGFGAVRVGAAPTTAVTFFEPDRVTGYLYQTSLDVQRQFGRDWLIDIGYLGTFGHHLASPDAQSINQVPADQMGPGNAQIRRPFPQYTNVQVLAADIGNSNYNALNAGLQKRYSSGLSLTVNYAYSQFIDNLDARNELAAYPGVNAFTNYYDQGSDKGRSGNDITHRFVSSAVYDFPVGRGRRYGPSSAVANRLLGGWTIGLIAEKRTGMPLSPIELNDSYTNSFSDGVRPNVVANPNLPSSRPIGDKLAEWFNTSAFAPPDAFAFGNAGRTFGEGPGAFSIDGSLLKDFAIQDKAVVQLRAEILNFLNHPIFGNPNTQQGSSNFGSITSLMPGNQARMIQFGLHLGF